MSDAIRDGRDRAREERDTAQADADARYGRAQEIAAQVMPGPVGEAIRDLLAGLRDRFRLDEDGDHVYSVVVVGRSSVEIVAVVDAVLGCASETS